MTALDHVRRVLEARPGRADDDPAARPAAVALVLHEDAGGLSALFIKRAEREGDPWSGQIAFPGGRYQDGDGSLLTTAIREAREEVGIHLAPQDSLGALDDVNPRTPHLPPIVVRPYVFAALRRPKLDTSPDEVQRAFWIPFSTLSDPDTRTQITLTLRGVPRTFTAYRADGEIIWGLTERIIRSFLERITV